jgi:hypothetical protein
LKKRLISKKSDEVDDLNRVIIDESRGNVHYKVCRKESCGSFTDYAIYRISSRALLTPFFSNLSDDSFEDIYELGKYYFLRSEKCYSGFAFMDSRKLREIPVPNTFEKTGTFLNPVAAMTHALNKLSEEDCIRLNATGFISTGKKSELQSFLNNWLEKGYIKADPRNNEKVIFKFIHPFLGNISNESYKNRMIVNANFFVLETMDMCSPYSMVGQPFGALIGNGKVMLPPLFRRETLLRHKDGRTEVRATDISDVRVVIGNDTYIDGVNARFFRRPDFERTPTCNGTDLIIVNDEMLAFKQGGNSHIPDAGFVVQVHSTEVPCNKSVKYFFDDSVDFAVQAGPSLIVDGEASKTIKGEFNSLETENHRRVSFPPNVFETEWDVSKAARMAMGFTENEMVFLWVAGCNTGE